MGIGIKIAPGVRISASSRGVRAGIGPRAARVHVGSGGVGLSTGAGPVTLYSGTGRGGRRSSGRSTRTSLAAYEREVRAAQRAEEIARIDELERGLVALHLEHYEPVSPPSARPPELADIAALSKQHRKREMKKEGFVARFKPKARREVKERAHQLARKEAAEFERAEAQRHAEEQADLDRAWDRLLGNDRETVMAVLEDAFEDNQSPAAPLDVDGGRASVVMLFPTTSAIPEQKPARTPTGRPTLRKRNKTEIHDLYAKSLASAVLATAKEAFAVAPSLTEATVLVVRKDDRAGNATDYLSAIYAATFTRTHLDALGWASVDPVHELYTAPGALLKRKGSTGQIVPIDLKNEPELESVLSELREALTKHTPALI
jgi:hypothetical protein